MDQGQVNPKMKLEDQGIKGLGYVYYNRSEAELHDAAVAAGEGVTGKGGTFLVTAGTQAGLRKTNSLCAHHLLKTKSGGTTTPRWTLQSSTFFTPTCWST